MEIKVISSDLDGAALKQEKQGRYIRCDGRADDQAINEAIRESTRRDGNGRVWAGLGDAWERIFGRSDS